jgi:endonuclease YncB( thermonuclease family)
MALTRWQHRRTAGAPADKARSFVGLTLFAKVVSIYDGDTITVATRLPGEKFYNYKFRLADLDAPEVRLDRADPDRVLHKAAGIRVREHLTTKIPPGTVIVIECTGDDKYGRLLGVIHTAKWVWRRARWQKAENINQWLLDRGFVLGYDGGKKAKFSAAHLQNIGKSTLL